ncbi:MAG TPA: SDR family NAD(P)-dependent oxidoreductase [Nitrososphaerales archaeon]|nr:SDR family NAD(P)-dependent oxidoreductase [Nitrososphaerales archaeon]
MKRFEGRNAIVTGATSGIGESIARRLASEGATVAIVGRRPKKGVEVARSILAQGGKAFYVSADMRDSKSVADMFRTCMDRFGACVSILVNNAGISKGNATMEYVNEDDWDDVMDTNAKGTFLCSKAAIPWMIKNGGGSIVNLSSGGGLRAYIGGTAYSASKAAVIMLTKVLAIEHGNEKIRVNCICPGSIHSEMFDGGIKNFEKKMAAEGKTGFSSIQIAENIARQIPLGRIGEPEVANLALFLSSTEASFISGSVIVIDGGMCL